MKSYLLSRDCCITNTGVPIGGFGFIDMYDLAFHVYP
jgi:hypothetical protein